MLQSKRAHQVAVCVDEPPSTQPAGPAEAVDYSQGLVDNSLESVLLCLAMGNSLRNSRSGLSTLSSDSIQMLSIIVSEEHAKEQSLAGFLTPPASPRASSPPKCPMAPARRSRVRRAAGEHLEGRAPKCLFARFCSADEEPAKGDSLAPREGALDALFAD